MITATSSADWKKILIYAPSWVGDAVMSLGAVRTLKSVCPGASLSVLARPWVADIYEACTEVETTILYDADGSESGLRGFLRTARELEQESFDMALLFPNAFRAAMLAWAARIPERWGYATDGRGLLLTQAVPPAPRPFGRHQTHYYLDLLHSRGIRVASCDNSLCPTEAMRRRAQALLRDAGWIQGTPLLGLHPGATNGTAKRWDSARYAEVGERLAARLDGRIVLLGGPDEKELTEKLENQLSTRPLVLTGKTSLGDLIGVLASLSILLSNDSGPMHIASALGVPTVAVFGPTDERETGPLGLHSRVVRQPVECSPCLHKDCPIDHRCMTGVGADRVYDTAMELLRKGQTVETAPTAMP